jgi:YidC/Oxa1 family membrane protein insertase
MAQHAPQLAELRKKYKNDKQRLNEETMKFYKENGVNPLAGCLPMIPQMIVFFSLFSVLRFIADWNPSKPLQYGFTEPVVASAQKATIFGVHLGDKLLFQPAGMHLSLQQVIVIVLTVAVSATTTFMTVRQSAKRGLMQTNMDPDNPMAQSQKFMQYIVPFFSLTGLYWQYGLVLYWVTTNLWTLGQQYFMFRNWTVDSAQPAGATASATPAARAIARPATRPAAARPAGVRPAAARPAAAGSAKGEPQDTVPRSEAKPSRGAKTASADTRRASGGAGNGRPATSVTRPRQARRTGRTARPSAGDFCDSADRSRNRSPRTTCPPLRWCGSSRCGRLGASGRASVDDPRRRLPTAPERLGISASPDRPQASTRESEARPAP